MIDDVRYMNIIEYASELGLVVITHAGVDIGLPEPVYCPPEARLSLPPWLKEIGREAFVGVSAQLVEIPEGVRHIDKRAFADSEVLLYIVIPDSVVEINETAFQGCPNVSICASRDSAAMRYAKRNGLPWIEY